METPPGPGGGVIHTSAARFWAYGIVCPPAINAAFTLPLYCPIAVEQRPGFNDRH